MPRTDMPTGEVWGAGPHAVPVGHTLEELRRLSDLGELAGPLAHEFNNFLNVLILNVAILEQRLPAELRADLEQVRRQGLAAAELVRQFQQCRRRPPVSLHPLDLNRVVYQVLATLSQPSPEVGRIPPVRVVGSDDPPGPDSIPVILDLATDLPPVCALTLDLWRLVGFLLTNAVAAAAQTGGSVTVRTTRAGDRVLLRVQDTGELVTGERLLHFFEPSMRGREGVNRLELAACKSLARRLEGKIEAVAGLEAGVTVVVELKAAT